MERELYLVGGRGVSGTLSEQATWRKYTVGEEMKKDTKPRKSKFAPKNPKNGHSTKSKRPVGRPRIELDEEQILKLAQGGMTDEEMSNFFDVSRDTIQNFRAVIKQGRSNLSQSIKRTQLQVALQERDKTMLIWVGKQYCGQKDKAFNEIEGKGIAPAQQIIYYGKDEPKTWSEENG
jgi:hypothetical protein